MAGFWVKVSEVRQRWFPDEESFRRQTGYENSSAYVQDDTMPATWHPATGETFESKSAFRRATKNAGCVELGDADMNPGQREIRIDDRAIGKQIWDLMEAKGLDYRDVRKQIMRDLRGEGFNED